MCAYVCVTESHRAGDKQFGCYGMRGIERERERERGRDKHRAAGEEHFSN